jgi:enoyl-CoA hydratase/carnithine racemase
MTSVGPVRPDADDPLEVCLRAVRSVPFPVIAMVHGLVWGGGAWFAGRQDGHPSLTARATT